MCDTIKGEDVQTMYHARCTACGAELGMHATKEQAELEEIRHECDPVEPLKLDSLNKIVYQSHDKDEIERLRGWLKLMDERTACDAYELRGMARMALSGDKPEAWEHYGGK